MEEKILSRIFEPFFSTKAPGKGTGMGLAAVYGTAMSHKGAIMVSSAVGTGSAFSLYLPLLAEDAGQVIKESTQPKSISGTARILLVEDEEMVCDVAVLMLESMGYTVTACRNGKEAVALYESEWSSIDLVIIDMVMPVMGGRETFDAMRQINPDINVLLSSGYSIDGEAQAILKAGAKGFIQKPFRKGELSLKVSEMLGKGFK